MLSENIIRKTGNILICFSIFICTIIFEHWYVSLIPYVLIYILFISLYKKTDIGSIERLNVRNQMTLFILSNVLMITIFWGAFGIYGGYHASIGQFSWGFGDSAAGVLGERYGKKKYSHKIFDVNKTIEGSIFMFLTSLMITALSLSLIFHLAIKTSLVNSLYISVATTIVEAMSKKGTDTLMVPLTGSFISFFMVGM